MAAAAILFKCIVLIVGAFSPLCDINFEIITIFQFPELAIND